MKNYYMSMEDYKRYIALFNLNEDDTKEVNKVMNKVLEIILLKRETQQSSTTLYLKPLMLPTDYREIDKVLNTQRNFKLQRIVKRYKAELEEKEVYRQDEIDSKVEDFRENLRKKLGLKKSKNTKKIEEEDIFTLDDLENL